MSISLKRKNPTGVPPNAPIISHYRYWTKYSSYSAQTMCNGPEPYDPGPWPRGKLSQKHCVAIPGSQNLARVYAREYLALCLESLAEKNDHPLTLCRSQWVAAVPCVVFFLGPRTKNLRSLGWGCYATLWHDVWLPNVMSDFFPISQV